ncbi:roadblock/LC7 domain-containing protein [Ilumatobacter sp.]|uniref:roadblock/LC7 domain-containing protein n=1 Tax=Ilumatobacter sp. TaxID=1967498 RepID=UPI003B51D96C
MTIVASPLPAPADGAGPRPHGDVASPHPTSAPNARPLAPPPPPAPAPTRRPPDTVVEALDELCEVVPGANGALLASVDGFALARSDAMPDDAAQSAMIAASVGLARQLVGIGGGEQLRQLVVDHDGGLLLLWPIGTSRVLAMLTDSRVDQAGLRRYVRSRATLLAGGS